MFFNLLIGLLIYRRNPQSRSAQGFLILTSSFALWLGSAAAQRASEGAGAILWNMAQYAGAALIIVTFTYFTNEFLIDSKTVLNSKELRWTLYIAGIILAATCFSGTIITNEVKTGTYLILGSSYEVQYGAFGPAYLLYNVVFVAGILVNLIAYLQSMVTERSPNRKKGIGLILMGGLLVGIIGTITDLILPMLGLRMPLADILTIIETGVIAIAMVRYKVFDIGKSALGGAPGKRARSTQGPYIIVPTTKRNEDLVLFKEHLDKGAKGILITTASPDKFLGLLKGLDAPVISISEKDAQNGHLDPTQFSEIFEALSYFLSKSHGGVILFRLADGLIERIINSHSMVWAMIGYFKKLEVMVQQSSATVIISRSGGKDEDILRYPGIDEMLLNSRMVLGPLQAYGFLEPLMDGLSQNEKMRFRSFFEGLTDKRYTLELSNARWKVLGPEPADRHDILVLIRQLHSTLRAIERKDLEEVLLMASRKIGIKDAEVLLHPGGAYMVLGEDGAKAFEHLYRLSDHAPCLCIIKSPPDKIKRTYGLHEGCKILWMSDQASSIRSTVGFDTIKPNLEYIVKSVLGFLDEKPRAVILIEGIDYFIAKKQFVDVLKAVERMVDTVWLSKGILIVPLDPKAIDGKELAILEKLFEVV
jgi:hypothetical protein